tara:strand:+ start:1127 stop:1393 length:267 start_codon:yes stop_codon:yes gene_type:complete
MMEEETPFTVTDNGDYIPPSSFIELPEEDLEEDYRPFSLWIDGWSAYVISKYEVGENVTLCCAGLNPPELLHLGRSIKKVLDEYGVDL